MHRYGDSFIKNVKGIPYMELNEKNHYDTGFAAGKLLVMSKNSSVSFLRSFSVRVLLGLTYKLAKKHVKEFKVPDEYKKEIKGYSDATGIPFEEIFLLNFSFDILRKYGLLCSTFSFNNGGSMIVARNTDLDPYMTELALHYENTILTKISIPGKQSFVSATVPFFVDVFNGFNESGLAVNAHEVLGIKERVNNRKLATTLLTRVLLERAKRINQAGKIIKSNPPHRPLNLIVTSQKEKDSRVFEISYPSISTIKSNGKYLACTTFFQSRKMDKFRDAPPKTNVNRLSVMNEILSKKNKLSLDEIIKILRDHRDGLEYTDTGYSIANNGTFQSFIFDLAKRIVYVNNGKKRPVPLNGKYVKIKLN